jgi:hypothetical protein
MTFVGVTVTSMTARNNMMNQICYDKVRCGKLLTVQRMLLCSALLHMRLAL